MMKQARYVIPLVLVAALLLPLTAFAQGPEQGTTAGRYCATPLTHGVAEAINVDARDLVLQVRSGATLAQIITEAGSSVDDLVAAEVADFRARLDEAVANGLITAEAADARAEQYGQTITARLNGERPAAVGVPPVQGEQPGQPPAGQPNAAPRQDNARRLVQAVAEATGLVPAAVVEMVEGGMTLAEVASENGADPAAIIEALVTEARTEADARLAALETALTAAMNGETPPQPIDAEALRTGAERIVVNAVLEATGTQLEPRALVQSLCDGATVAVLISEAGGDPGAVMADINTQVSDALNNLVSQERLSEEQAADVLARINTFVDDLFNGRVNLPALAAANNAPRQQDGPRGQGNAVGSADPAAPPVNPTN